MKVKVRRIAAPYIDVPTESLQAILRNHAHDRLMVRIGTEQLYAIMEELARRDKASGTQLRSSEAAWAEFVTHYMPRTVKVRKWEGPAPCTPAMDAWALWMVGRMPGAIFERIALRCGQERWLYRPSSHGKYCPSNGEHKGIECRCEECDFYLDCFPDWEDYSV